MNGSISQVENGDELIHVKFGRGKLPGPKFSGCFRRTIPIALTVEQYLEEVQESCSKDETFLTRFLREERDTCEVY